MRFHHLVGKENYLLGVIVQVRDVANGVIVVLQVLQLLVVTRAYAEQVREPEGERVVLVSGGYAVAVLYLRALALGVVINVLNKPCGTTVVHCAIGFVPFRAVPHHCIGIPSGFGRVCSAGSGG